MPPPIILFTDFGYAGPYVGEMHLAVANQDRHLKVVDLMHDAPRCDPRASAYLLAALCARVPCGSVVVAVVDPGVGSARAPLMVYADGTWLIGPDNGLFSIATRRAGDVDCFRIDWRPDRLSRSFHGRDLFAPVAARVAAGLDVPRRSHDPVQPDWPDDLFEVIYIDGFGNLVTGLRSSVMSADQSLWLADRQVAHAETFLAAPPRQPFWYVNSMDLIEVALSGGHAAGVLGVKIGQTVDVR